MNRWKSFVKEKSQKKKKERLTIQDLDLQMPEVTHSTTKTWTFRRNTVTSPPCAEKIEAVKKCGMHISES